ncbi:MAG: glycosyltransferase family 39 protein [Rhodoglobus sp.]
MALVTPEAPPRAGGRIRALSMPRAAGLVGLAAGVSSATLSWTPSYWGDEAASVMSAQRSVPSLFLALGHIDAVHGLYYLFLHFWIRLVGVSEFAVRFPSAVGVAVAAVGVVLLTRQFSSQRVAIIAGLACAVLPRFTYMGMEARSYALSTAIAVWLTVLLVVLVRTGSRRRLFWAAYLVLAAIGIWLFLYLGLLLIAHMAFILLDRRARTVRRPWAIATGGALLLAAPITLFAVQQRHQIAFLGTDHPLSVGVVLVEPWFGNAFLAVLGWALMALAVAFALRHRRYPASRLVLLSTVWLLAPLLILVLASATVLPIYTVRYLSFATPAAAILVALGINALGRHWLRWVAIGLVIALAIPTWIDQRGEFAKDGGSDWRLMSEYIKSKSSTGDGIYFDPSTKPSQRPRLALHVYPTDFTNVTDVAIQTPFTKRTTLWDSAVPLAQLYPRLSGIHKLWVVDLAGSPEQTSGDQRRILAGDGFHLAATTALHRSIVYEYTR